MKGKQLVSIWNYYTQCKYRQLVNIPNEGLVERPKKD